MDRVKKKHFHTASYVKHDHTVKVNGSGAKRRKRKRRSLIEFFDRAYSIESVFATALKTKSNPLTV